MNVVIDNNNIGLLTKACNLPTIKVEWEELLKPATRIVTLSYTISDLQQEVEKRTSYLGKFRNSEQAAHLLDLIAMTKDESDIFSSFCQSVSVELYDCFDKFAGNENSKFVYDETGGNINFVFVIPDSVNTAFIQPLDISTKDALVYGIIYQWLLMAYPADAETYTALYANALQKVRECANKRNKGYTMIIPRAF